MTQSDSESGPGSDSQVFMWDADDGHARDAGLEKSAIGDTIVEVDIVTNYAEARAQAIDDFERNFIRDLLECNDHNVTQSARSAGMDRVYLHRLMRKHKLKGARHK